MENAKSVSRAEAEKWLRLPEVELGYHAIGKLVIAAADCCMSLRRQNATDRDAIKLVLVKTECGKEQIANFVFSNLSFPDKQHRVEQCCRESFSYFNDLMAQK